MNEQDPISALIPLASLLGTWVVKRLLVLINKYGKGSEWVMPVASMAIAVGANYLLEQAGVYIDANAPAGVRTLYAAFMGTAATGFHQIYKRGRDGVAEFSNKSHSKFP